MRGKAMRVCVHVYKIRGGARNSRSMNADFSFLFHFSKCFVVVVPFFGCNNIDPTIVVVIVVAISEDWGKGAT